MYEVLFGTLGTSERVLKLLKSSEDYGGPQSAKDVCINLKMKPKNAYHQFCQGFARKEKLRGLGKALTESQGMQGSTAKTNRTTSSKIF